jgi:hypothetical protein
MNLSHYANGFVSGLWLVDLGSLAMQTSMGANRLGVIPDSSSKLRVHFSKKQYVFPKGKHAATCRFDL